jgi:Macrocin-O-methyltransferase (TylF)
MDFILHDMLVDRGIADPLSLVRRSGLNVPRLKGLVGAINSVLEGDTAEIGCKAGGTSRVMALINRGRRHWACDTFSGLVDCDKDRDGKLFNGQFEASRAEAERVLAGLSNVVIIEGIFPQSATPEMCNARFGVVHVDVDTYKSTLATFEFFTTRMVSDGLIVMDDVLWPGPKGAITAFNELMAAGKLEIIEENPPQAIVRLVA